MSRWGLPLVCMGLGLGLLYISLAAHALWRIFEHQASRALAESYRFEFWAESAGGLVLVILGAFVAGLRLGRPR
ncbi:MAG: hypothetical protein OEN23_09915 [Paracoccaceae bacterium]|nr:hypothetical protein [Paracoccaceae bacterium]